MRSAIFESVKYRIRVCVSVFVSWGWLISVCVCVAVFTESYSEGTYTQLLVFEGFVMVCVGVTCFEVFPEFDGSCLDV